MFKNLKADIQAALKNDPAARNAWEVFFTYSGVKALYHHRIAHWFYNHNMKFIARWISQRSRHKTGIEIHPGAKIQSGVFIDHGMGVVIGETAEVATGVIIYQGVTLGGTGKDKGKRHPTIEEDVMISSGAKVLGPFKVGKGSKIGAGSVVLKEVPPYSTVVGVPGRVVKQFGQKVSDDLDQIKLPDPILEEFIRLNKRIEKLEDQLGVKSCRYSITNNNVIESEKNVVVNIIEKDYNDTEEEILNIEKDNENDKNNVENVIIEAKDVIIKDKKD